MFVLKCTMYKKGLANAVIINFPMIDDSPKTFCEVYKLANRKAKFMEMFIDDMKILEIG